MFYRIFFFLLFVLVASVPFVNGNIYFIIVYQLKKILQHPPPEAYSNNNAVEQYANEGVCDIACQTRWEQATFFTIHFTFFLLIFVRLLSLLSKLNSNICNVKYLPQCKYVCMLKCAQCKVNAHNNMLETLYSVIVVW